MFSLRRNRLIRQRLVQYLETAILTANCFRDGMRHYGTRGLEGLDDWVRDIHRTESQCDRIRRGVELDLFAKSLLPEFREDIMALLERLDSVVNQTEEVLRRIVLEAILLPADLNDGYGELVDLCHRACRVLFEQAIGAMESDENVHELGERVGSLEGDADRVEQRLIRDLFAKDIEPAAKLHCRDLIAATSAIADLAEDAANAITVFRVKRTV
ncbi:MAG: DUF47 family protein [Lentisphaeria bacterium]|nr:DUF47 family protein [Lentisphaeria bacterium]